MSIMRAVFLLSLAASVAAPIPAARAQPVHTTYAASDEILFNPERGFYAHQSAQTEYSALSRSQLQQLKQNDVSLILRIYYLKKFRATPLSEAQLTLIQRDMDLLREVGMKAILRFAYSSSENEADAPLQTIETHLDQLKPILEDNLDVIAAAEAGFIGAWGEWYYSSNNLNTTAGRRAVLQKWLSVLPSQRMVQVRTPGYKKAIYGRNTPIAPEEAYDGSNYARTGHHNDCFLASSTDYGTYNSPSDKPYLAADSRYTTMGGETCNPNPPRSECATALDELAAFHWSYLNQDYHQTVLNSWETGGCMDEVKRRLGYRFRLIDSDLPAAVKPGSAFTFGIRLANDGFSAPFNRRPVEIVLREQQTGERHVVRLSDDARYWAPGETTYLQATVGIPPDMPEGIYDVLLNLPAPERSIYGRADYAVRLANQNVWEPENGYNSLLTAAVVSSDAPEVVYEGNIWFRPYDAHVSAEGEQPTSDFKVSATYPNPFASSTVLEVQVSTAQPISIRVYDVVGRAVATLFDGMLVPGEGHSFSFEPAGLPGGLYLVAVRGRDFHTTRSALYIP